MLGRKDERGEKERGVDRERGVGEYDVVQRWFDGGLPENTWEAEGTKKTVINNQIRRLMSN